MDEGARLLVVLETVDEAETFLRKRCAAGLAGQVLGLLAEMDSLIELTREQFQKTGLLPAKGPTMGPQTDILTIISYLDQIQRWSKDTRERIGKRQLRQKIALGRPFDQSPPQQPPPPAAEPAPTPEPEPEPAPEPAPAPAAAQKAASTSLLEAMAGASSRTTSRKRESPRAQRSAGTQPADADGPSARPMGSQNPTDGPSARPMGSQNPTDGPSARPMGAEAPPARQTDQGDQRTQEARPGGAGAPAAHSGRADAPRTQPMGAAQDLPTARPMGAEAALQRASAQPMGSVLPQPPDEERPKRRERTEDASYQPAVRGSGNGRPLHNIVDREFFGMMDEIGRMDEPTLYRQIAERYPKLENRYKMVLADTARRYPYTGTITPEQNDYSLLKNRAYQLKHHYNDFLWLYSRLGDYRSRQTLFALIDNWYSFNFKEPAEVREKIFPPYFDYDLLHMEENEIFIDAGAHAGETAEEFYQSFGACRKLICYEITDTAIAGLTQAAAAIPGLEVRRKALAEMAGHSYVETFSGDASTAHLAEWGTGTQVETVRLDDDFSGTIGLLRLSLAGGELAALKGARGHLSANRPRIVVRLDHRPGDLWEIPRLVDECDHTYRFYLRHYGGNILPNEFVLFAI